VRVAGELARQGGGEHYALNGRATVIRCRQSSTAIRFSSSAVDTAENGIVVVALIDNESVTLNRFAPPGRLVALENRPTRLRDSHLRGPTGFKCRVVCGTMRLLIVGQTPEFSLEGASAPLREMLRETDRPSLSLISQEHSPSSGNDRNRSVCPFAHTGFLHIAAPHRALHWLFFRRHHGCTYRLRIEAHRS